MSRGKPTNLQRALEIKEDWEDERRLENEEQLYLIRKEAEKCQSPKNSEKPEESILGEVI
jgi:hypothetical protein